MKNLLTAFVLIAQAGVATAGERTNASEATVRAICKSSAPVLVIDSFAGDPSNEKIMDMDGNGSYDMYHGDFVARLVEIHGQPTIREVVGTPAMPAQLLSILKKYIARIEAGEKIAWINYSQGATREFDYLNHRLRLKNEINGNNVHLYARRILEAIWTDRPQDGIKELYEAFVRLGELGVPVVMAAANSGYKEVNIYSLFPNVISVGAYGQYGKADYSADNSTITLWRTGDIYSASVDGGLDLNGDGRADIALETPAIPMDILKSYEGRRGSQAALRVPPDIDRDNRDGSTVFFELTAKLPKGLYSTYEIASKTLATPFQQAQYIKKLGEYFYLDGVHAEPLFFMPTDNNGLLKIRQGRPAPGGYFRNVLYGTSFSSPSICDGTTTPEDYAL